MLAHLKMVRGGFPLIQNIPINADLNLQLHLLTLPPLAPLFFHNHSLARSLQFFFLPRCNTSCISNHKFPWIDSSPHTKQYKAKCNWIRCKISLQSNTIQSNTCSRMQLNELQQWWWFWSDSKSHTKQNIIQKLSYKSQCNAMQCKIQNINFKNCCEFV